MAGCRGVVSWSFKRGHSIDVGSFKHRKRIVLEWNDVIVSGIVSVVVIIVIVIVVNVSFDFLVIHFYLYPAVSEIVK